MRSSLKNIPISISILHDTEHRNIMKQILGKRRAYSDCNIMRGRNETSMIKGSLDLKVSNIQMSHLVTVS